MEQSQKIEIAIDMLAGTILDRHWNRITHSERNIITNNVIDILEEMKNDIEQKSNLIIPKNCQRHNPPDES